MQRNVNIATGFKPRTAKGLRFSALMHETHGHVGEYWCEADALEDAKAEAIAAHGDHNDHWAALSAAGYELKTAAHRMEQLYDKLGGHA